MEKMWRNISDSISRETDCYDYNENQKENILGNFYLQYFKSLNRIMHNKEAIISLVERKFNAIKTDDKNLLAFLEWYESQAVNYLDTIIQRIDYSKLNNKFDAYIKLYSKYLENANNNEVLYEFLYLIPKKMCNDFEHFNFFISEPKDEVFQQTFLKCYDRIQDVLKVLDCNYSISMEYLFNNEMEPDVSQALVLYI